MVELHRQTINGTRAVVRINGHYANRQKTGLKRYEEQCARAGIHKAHGHRHQYAQQRYLELTRRLAPAAGGTTSMELSTKASRENNLINNSGCVAMCLCILHPPYDRSGRDTALLQR